MLEFVIGTPASGKTRYIMERIASDAQQNRRAVLITTRQATHAMERRLIRDHLPQGLLSVQVWDMDRLAQNILEDAGGNAGEHLSSLGRMMAVRAVSAKCKDDLQIFGQALSQDGFATRISAQIEELWRWQVTPAELSQAVQTVTSDQLRKKLADIALIQSACQAYFEQHDCAQFDAMRLAAEKADQVPWLCQTTFYVDGLELENAASRALLGRVLSLCPNMVLTVCMDLACAQQARFDTPRTAMSLYRQMAQDAGVETCEHVVHNADVQADALSHLRENLFVYPGKAYGEDASCITVTTCRDPRHEAQSVAAKIIDLCRTKNLRFRDITVLCAGGKAGYAQVRRAFEKYDIPAFYDVRRDLHGNACAGLVVHLIKACMGAWSTKTILPILKSGLTCFERDAVCEAENYILRHGITDPVRWKRAWCAKGGENAEALRKEVVALLSPFFESMQGYVTCQVRVDAIFDVLEALGVCDRLEQSVLDLQADGFSQEAAVTSQVWKVICEVLGQMSHVMGNESFSLGEFCAILQEGFLATQLGIIPTTLDQVTVSDPSRWNGDGAKVLFLIGATDDALSPAAQDGSLFDDDDVLMLMQQADLTVSVEPRLRASQFKISLYRALCAAQEMIIITRPLQDMAGQPTAESQVVSHLKRLFPKANTLLPETIPTCVQEGFSKWARGMRRAAEGFDAPVWLASAGAWFDQNEAWQKKAQSVRRMLRRDLDQVLDEKLAKRLYAPMQMSVTQLENYAKCPFAHFAHYALQARMRQEFSEGALADTGSFVHEMMYQLGRDILSGNVNVYNFDAQDWTCSAFDTLDEEAGYYASLGGSASGKAIRNRLMDNVIHAAENLVRSLAQSEFQIAAVEQNIPPMTLETEAGDVTLAGRIDRVDVAHLSDLSAARVVDYKSSAKNTALSQIYYGQQLQLAAYLLAVCENPDMFGADALMPGGMLYFPIGDRNTVQDDAKRMHGIVSDNERIKWAMDTEVDEAGRSDVVAPVSRGSRGGRLSDDAMELLLRFTKDEMTRLAGNAVKGDARACPAWTSSAQKRACMYCDYAGACGFDVRMRPLQVNRMPDLNNEQVLEKMNGEEDDNGKNA